VQLVALAPNVILALSLRVDQHAVLCLLGELPRSADDTEEAIVVATGAPRQRGGPPWVVARGVHAY
jgi:hypothetical protein